MIDSFPLNTELLHAKRTSYSKLTIPPFSFLVEKRIERVLFAPPFSMCVSYTKKGP